MHSGLHSAFVGLDIVHELAVVWTENVAPKGLHLGLVMSQDVLGYQHDGSWNFGKVNRTLRRWDVFGVPQIIWVMPWKETVELQPPLPPCGPY